MDSFFLLSYSSLSEWLYLEFSFALSYKRIQIFCSFKKFEFTGENVARHYQVKYILKILIKNQCFTLAELKLFLNFAVRNVK